MVKPEKKKVFFFFNTFVHAGARGGTCAQGEKLSTRGSTTAHATIDPQPRHT